MLALILALAAQVAAAPPAAPARGVTEQLARERADTIADVRYELAFVVPPERQRAVQGQVVVRFRLQAPRRLVLDFDQPPAALRAVRVGGSVPDFTFENGHIVIPAGATRAGENEVAVDFVAGDEPLNRTDDLLYTLFVPARAHRTFPVFDQPNLKARFRLTLDVPNGWKAVANAREAARLEPDAAAVRAGAPDRIRFAETRPIPPYLFAFVAGRFEVETAVRQGREFRMFHRETDPARLARNRDALFDLHAAALVWLEEYTDHVYPWDKFDFVTLPAFQFSGMEHPGAILYNASLFLDESATQQQLLERASTVAHETAHMWFGNLVTMSWFSDVWMKEVFANFMAAKIVNPRFPEVNHDLRFLLAHHPGAYQVDRTAGANPVRQPLSNLNEAGQLYGPIIYQKAPIVMRQLELLLGERELRDGLREYLRTYEFGNASWLDLVALLDARTPENLAAWSRVWVEERGRPEITTAIRTRRGAITELTLRVSDPLRRGLVWPQRLSVVLGYADRLEPLPVTVSAAATPVAQAAGRPQPLFVLPSGGGLGYGLFVLDRPSRDYLLAHAHEIPDALTRGSAWVTLWENMLESFIPPGAMVDALLRGAATETDEQNRQRLLSYLVRAYWRYLRPPDRLRRAPGIEYVLRVGLDRAMTGRQKGAWFNAYRDIVTTPAGVAWLERVWRRDELVPGLPFSETDEIAMALELAVRDVPAGKAILAEQLARTENPDRKARLAFVMPALAADPAEREQAFARFADVRNRRREPWVIESLAYLNHPLREAHARRFVRPSLELLREIQTTGDIFFPARWADAALAGHRSPEVAVLVRDFLARELQYPLRLRWTLLSAADDLLRGR